MEIKPNSLVFVSLPTRKNSLRAGIGAILGYRGCGKSSHFDFSSPSRGSSINRLIKPQDNCQPSRNRGWVAAVCALWFPIPPKGIHPRKPLPQTNRVLHGAVATATPPCRPSLNGSHPSMWKEKHHKNQCPITKLSLLNT